MRKVLIYSLLLLLGLAGTQVLAIVAPDAQADTATAVKLLTMFGGCATNLWVTWFGVMAVIPAKGRHSRESGNPVWRLALWTSSSAFTPWPANGTARCTLG
ncbi:MAG: hypothetical protein HY699_00170 [Deltaproteobacteria bacterium]|nr:hypothetical protein [Deltaproteobacteria bacterium]